MTQNHHQYAITIKSLNKTYKASGANKANGASLAQKPALRDINLSIPQGKIFGLLGPNGAGKSTLINILAGLVIKTSGEVDIWGFSIDKNPRQARASIGVVPQELNMDAFFTPFELMELQAGFYGVPKHKRHSIEILEALGLKDKAYAYARSLSGGMRRRLLVAKSLAHQPPILVLDEPTAGVDVVLRRSLWAYVEKLNALGTTILLTTHYLEEAQKLCDEIAIIDEGELVVCDKTKNLLNHIGQKQLKVKPKQPIGMVPPNLNQNGLSSHITKDGELIIEFQAHQKNIGELLSLMAQENITINDLEICNPTLEDVFLKLTRA